MQHGLIDVGYPMPRSTSNGTKSPDGIYGQETSKILKQFQRDNALVVDGVAGRLTLGRLDELLLLESSYSAAAENASLGQQMAGSSGSQPFAATTARRS